MLNLFYFFLVGLLVLAQGRGSIVDRLLDLLEEDLADYSPGGNEPCNIECDEINTNTCHSRCSTCKSGDASDGGIAVVNGVCNHWCSSGGYCGTSNAYKSATCTGCKPPKESGPVITVMELREGTAMSCVDSDRLFDCRKAPFVGGCNAADCNKACLDDPTCVGHSFLNGKWCFGCKQDRGIYRGDGQNWMKKTTGGGGTDYEVIGNYQVYYLDGGATYSSIDQALLACSSARDGGKPVGNYPQTSNTCGDKVAVLSGNGICARTDNELFWCLKKGYNIIGNENSGCAKEGKSFLTTGSGWTAKASGKLLCAVAIDGSKVVSYSTVGRQVCPHMKVWANGRCDECFGAMYGKYVTGHGLPRAIGYANGENIIFFANDAEWLKMAQYHKKTFMGARYTMAYKNGKMIDVTQSNIVSLYNSGTSAGSGKPYQIKNMHCPFFNINEQRKALSNHEDSRNHIFSFQG